MAEGAVEREREREREREKERERERKRTLPHRAKLRQRKVSRFF